MPTTVLDFFPCQTTAARERREAVAPRRPNRAAARHHHLDPRLLAAVAAQETGGPAAIPPRSGATVGTAGASSRSTTGGTLARSLRDGPERNADYAADAGALTATAATSVRRLRINSATPAATGTGRRGRRRCLGYADWCCATTRGSVHPRRPNLTCPASGNARERPASPRPWPHRRRLLPNRPRPPAISHRYARRTGVRTPWALVLAAPRPAF